MTTVKDFYKKLKKAGFTHCIGKMREYKNQLGLKKYEIEHIPLYLEWEKGAEKRRREKISKANKGCKAWNKNIPMNETTKRKISKKLKGRKKGPLSEEHKKKISEKLKGRIFGPMSEEHKKKISKASIGKKMDEVSKKKMSISHIGKKASVETRKKLSKIRKNHYVSPATRLKLSEKASARAKKGTKKSIIYNNQYFDSSWELIFYKWCLERGLEIERSVPVKLPSGHRYIVDFRVNGMLVEIKGPHFFHEGKLIVPFNNPNKIQDEHSREKQEYWETHNVLVIKDITPYL